MKNVFIIKVLKKLQNWIFPTSKNYKDKKEKKMKGNFDRKAESIKFHKNLILQFKKNIFLPIVYNKVYSYPHG